ncbi:hypothetical protein L798_11389 [Zootermopsis nevadensis]|uniref:Uncharacterized protein n=1 Tax=Zootermopsis nevadensis TaxID=136037 RepID=A0A067RVA0_ZOONE|nr:hypothetical protein L798_11389 [Zootermopsis nevadensis]
MYWRSGTRTAADYGQMMASVREWCDSGGGQTSGSWMMVSSPFIVTSGQRK